MEDNRPNQDLTNQDIEFIKEKVKERPLNRRKLFKKTLLTASMAAIFGLIACVTFLVLEPVFSNLLYPEEEPQQVELKEENIEDEMRPEDMILEEETETETTTELQTVVEKVALEIGDYQKLYRNMYTVAKTFADHSMVTVTGVVSDVDWFDNTYENQGQTAGLIVADNGKELLILVDAAAIRQAEELEVSFYSGRSVSASLKGKDEETGLAILSVALEDIPEDIRKNVGSATMGSSGSSVQAVPVIAIGRPQGAETIIFGMVTSADYYQNLTDHNVRLLKTDMTGLQGTGGVLINLSGKVLGIVHAGEADEIHLEKHVPVGAYVTGIIMDSPAMKAGIQSGDVIVGMEGEEITSFADYHAALLSCEPDTTVTVTVMRQGQEEYQEMEIEVLLQE